MGIFLLFIDKLLRCRWGKFLAWGEFNHGPLIGEGGGGGGGGGGEGRGWYRHIIGAPTCCIVPITAGIPSSSQLMA